MLTDLSDWVTDVIDKLGYVGVALLVALENLFPPIPSEIVLPFAGFVARDGGATLLGMIIAATIGSTVGAGAPWPSRQQQQEQVQAVTAITIALVLL